MPLKNVFLIGLDDTDLARLKTIRNADRYAFHAVLEPAEVLETYDFPVRDMLSRAETQLRQWEKDTGQLIDGIGAYLDFPVSTMLPILCSRLNKRGPGLENLLKCEHKYWSRLVQKEVIARHIPDFTAFDPFDDLAFEQIRLPLPFWIKPIKACGSMLGFYIQDRAQFDQAILDIRSRIHLISDPFNYILQQAAMPEALTGIQGHFFLAESIIRGWQCTLEGYVLNGDIQPLGFIDSLRYENAISFFRYEYPSVLPDMIQDQMIEIAKRVIAHTGLDNCAFNIEFFWNLEQDRIWLLEINPRVSQSHSDMFEKVDGQSNQQITVQVACGEKPDFPRGQGQFACAAKFFWRIFSGDARVTRVPTPLEIREVEKQFPGTVIHPQIREGMKLSDLLEQDSYSYAICHLFIGARDRKELLDKYLHCMQMLCFEFAPV
ncbi:MAG: ATP-grasp domain-containing protein [Desulfobacterales bacterium]|nr:ATP-grasp domain-containing protein [Desulfobacterales bacterium]